MLHAKRTSLSTRSYEITRDGRALTTFSPGGRKRLSGGCFPLGGTGYEVRSHRFTRVYELLDDGGSVVAATSRVGRRWQLRAAGRVFHFRRNSFASREQSAFDEKGNPIGSLTSTGRGKPGATADLPGLEPELQVFALVVTLLRRQRKRAAAAVRASALTGG
ncbi:hypothetical protein [Amycolatopsis sp. CA-230715]|uniref:hypothetical protein n=1 Tax=Amycolatopsis sp. CA-230715 TaxID=2745196 RepID=UPI001C0141E2|nr:hypothetical protein [Amycolatopsis sp. CA-230715]QWF78589.1 hypothetical protein HUW46_01987 [Amycolatopsis sp. CA-230715]